MELFKWAGNDLACVAIYDNPAALACYAIPHLFLDALTRVVVNVQRERLVLVHHDEIGVEILRRKMLWRHTNVIKEVHDANSLSPVAIEWSMAAPC